MEKKRENRVHGFSAGFQRPYRYLTFSGPWPASTNPRRSQPGLSPSGQMRGQIGPGGPRTSPPMSLRLLVSTSPWPRAHHRPGRPRPAPGIWLALHDGRPATGQMSARLGGVALRHEPGPGGPAPGLLQATGAPAPAATHRPSGRRTPDGLSRPTGGAVEVRLVRLALGGPGGRASTRGRPSSSLTWTATRTSSSATIGCGRATSPSSSGRTIVLLAHVSIHSALPPWARATRMQGPRGGCAGGHSDQAGPGLRLERRRKRHSDGESLLHLPKSSPARRRTESESGPGDSTASGPSRPGRLQ
jgi:hypothetical protein